MELLLIDLLTYIHSTDLVHLSCFVIVVFGTAANDITVISHVKGMGIKSSVVLLLGIMII
jgi:hypothetical protein